VSGIDDIVVILFCPMLVVVFFFALAIVPRLDEIFKVPLRICL
jgi:hypothetical protein